MIPAYLVLCLGAGLTLFCANWLQKEIEQRAWERFKAESKVSFEIIGNGILRYLDAVRSAKSFAESHPEATTADWKTYTDGQEWRSRLPGLLDLGYAELKGGNENSKLFVRFVASRMTELHPAGTVLVSDGNTTATQDRARDTGFPQATSVIALRASTNQLGNLLFLAAYEGLASPAIDDRRVAFKGLAFASLDPEKLWQDVVQKTSRSSIAVALAGTPEALELARSKETFRKTIRYGTWGQQWPLLLVARIPFIDPASQRMPGMVLAFGAVTNLFLFFFISKQVQDRLAIEQEKANVTKANEELERRVADRTHELSLTNETLKTSLSRERDLNEMKSNFVSTVSHEFRTPLGIVVSSAEILERYFNRLSSAEREQHLRSIRQSAAQMTELMESVLQFSRAEAGIKEAEKESLDLVKLCHRIVDEVKSSTDGRCSIELTMPNDLPCAISNERLLRTIFINLLHNAVKYSAAGKSVHFRLERDHGNGVFHIVDQGIGIPEGDRPRLFSAFQRGSNSSGYSGTGLGLSLVKKCVDLHGGTLELKSQEGIGTTVSVCLPLFTLPDKT